MRLDIANDYCELLSDCIFDILNTNLEIRASGIIHFDMQGFSFQWLQILLAFKSNFCSDITIFHFFPAETFFKKINGFGLLHKRDR